MPIGITISTTRSITRPRLSYAIVIPFQIPTHNLPINYTTLCHECFKFVPFILPRNSIVIWASLHSFASPRYGQFFGSFPPHKFFGHCFCLTIATGLVCT